MSAGDKGHGARLFASPQLDLFGAPAPPAGPDPALLALARRQPEHVRLGTSSWTFPGWEGLIYRRRYGSKKAFVRESLAEYAAHPLFRTVGIDRSFYAPVPSEELAAYAAQLPEGFRCCMKVWHELTMRRFPEHPRFGPRAGQVNSTFLDPALFAERVFAPVDAGMGDAFGVFLLVFSPTVGPVDPPGFARALDRFLAQAPRRYPFAVELRDRRLFTRAYREVLRRRGAAHVVSYWSDMPPIGAQVRAFDGLPGEVWVARLMAPPGSRHEELKARFYPFDRLVAPQRGMRRDALRLAAYARREGRELYVIVSNHTEGCSPLTVRALAERLADLTPEGA